jgi:hypothetical protein
MPPFTGAMYRANRPDDVAPMDPAHRCIAPGTWDHGAFAEGADSAARSRLKVGV